MCSHSSLLKKKFAWFLPITNAVANAIANSPQSDPPDYIWTSMKCKVMDGFIVVRKVAICFFNVVDAVV